MASQKHYEGALKSFLPVAQELVVHPWRPTAAWEHDCHPSITSAGYFRSYIHFGHQGIPMFWIRAIQLVLWPSIASAVSLLLTEMQQGRQTSRLQGKLAKQNGTCSVFQSAVVNSTSVTQKVQYLCLILYISWSPNKTAFRQPVYSISILTSMPCFSMGIG